MKSSLPEIFRKDLKLLSLPEKQSSQFSLYLKTNAFKPNHQFNFQAGENNRYSNKSSSKRINKSMDQAFNQTNSSKFNLMDDNKGTKNQLKRLLSQKKSSRSRSLFIEEKNIDQMQEVDSFKAIRKRVLQEMSLFQKSMSIIKSTESSLKTSMQQFKKKEIQQLESFQRDMLKKMGILLNTFKELKREIRTQVKVNKEQLNYIEQEIKTYRQLVEQFEGKQAKLKYEIIQGGSPKMPIMASKK